MICRFCSQPVDPKKHENVLREIVGYEKPGRGTRGQSGSSLVLREATGNLVHKDCVVKMRSGLNPAQQGFI